MLSSSCAWHWPLSWTVSSRFYVWEPWLFDTRCRGFDWLRRLEDRAIKHWIYIFDITIDTCMRFPKPYTIFLDDLHLFNTRSSAIAYCWCLISVVLQILVLGMGARIVKGCLAALSGSWGLGRGYSKYKACHLVSFLSLPLLLPLSYSRSSFALLSLLFLQALKEVFNATLRSFYSNLIPRPLA